MWRLTYYRLRWPCLHWVSSCWNFWMCRPHWPFLTVVWIVVELGVCLCSRCRLPLALDCLIRQVLWDLLSFALSLMGNVHLRRNHRGTIISVSSNLVHRAAWLRAPFFFVTLCSCAHRWCASPACFDRCFAHVSWVFCFHTLLTGLTSLLEALLFWFVGFLFLLDEFCFIGGQLRWVRTLF